MKKRKAVVLLCLAVCLSVLSWATAAAQVTAPARASEFEIPAVFDKLTEKYGAPPQITEVEKTGDAEYIIRFDACPETMLGTPFSLTSYLSTVNLYPLVSGLVQLIPVTPADDTGLTYSAAVDPAMNADLQIEISYEYINAPLDEDRLIAESPDDETVVAYKDLYFDLQGNPLRMNLRLDPSLDCTLEYVNGNPVLVQYMDDEYDSTGERIAAYYSRDTGELTNYEYDCYVNDAEGKQLGLFRILNSVYSGLNAAFEPNASEWKVYEWDFEQGRWFEEASGESGDGSRNYDVEVPEEVPDPTTVALPVELSRQAGYSLDSNGSTEEVFFGVPEFSLPMTAQEALALSEPLPFDAAALPKPVSYAQENGGCLVQLSWDWAEAVRAALGEDGALSGEIDCLYLWEDEQVGLVGGPGHGTVDFETLSARIGAPEYGPEGGVELTVDSFTPVYDVQTPDGSFTVTYDCWCEEGASDIELHMIDVTCGPYSNLYSPDGILTDLVISDPDNRGSDCTCYYDETGALSGYAYDLTSNLRAEFDTNGLSTVYYSAFLEGNPERQWFQWTAGGGWTLEEWDDATGDFVYTPCEAPDGVDLSQLVPLI